MRGKIHCTNCEYEGKPKRVTPGSFLVELFLWLCFLAPGLIYSIWRISSKKSVCPDCGSERLIALKTYVKRKSIAAKEAL